MTPPKAYFLLPNTDIVPNTLVQLGQIVPSLKEPHRPIAPGQAIANRFASSRADYSLSTSSSNSVGIGLVAQFLAQLGSPVSGGLLYERSTKRTMQWNFKNLETVYFEPDSSYVEHCLQDTSVKEALQKSRTSAVYIITGLKIARGASYSTRVSRVQEGSAQLALDATAFAGAPFSAGPEVGIKTSTTKKETCGSCSDFVWAVRVRKVKLSFWKKTLEVSDVYGGDLHGVDDEMFEPAFADFESSDEEEDRSIMGGEVESWDMGATFEPQGFVKQMAMDENGEECAVCWQDIEN